MLTLVLVPLQMLGAFSIYYYCTNNTIYIYQAVLFTVIFSLPSHMPGILQYFGNYETKLSRNFIKRGKLSSLSWEIKTSETCVCS